MNTVRKDKQMLLEAYDSVESAQRGEALANIKKIIENLINYVSHVEHNPSMDIQPEKLLTYLARHIGPGMIGHWSDYKEDLDWR